MQIEFLGTGAGVPARFRNVTSIALRLLEEINSVWLFDAGEAAHGRRLAHRAAGVGAGRHRHQARGHRGGRAPG